MLPPKLQKMRHYNVLTLPQIGGYTISEDLKFQKFLDPVSKILYQPQVCRAKWIESFQTYATQISFS